MSDLMLYAVLRMPYELAMADELSRRQFYSRVQEAAARLEAAEAKLAGSTVDGIRPELVNLVTRHLESRGRHGDAELIKMTLLDEGQKNEKHN